MKVFNISLTVIGILFANNLIAQVPTFQKYYTNNLSNGLDITQSADSCYYITGIDIDTVSNHWRGYLIKTDKFGNEIWYKLLQGGWGISFQGVEVSNNQIYLSGIWKDNNNASQGMVMSLDTSGNILWSYKYGNGGKTQITAIDKTNNGVVAVGYTGDFGVTDRRAVIISIDSLGNTLWSKTLSGPLEYFFHAVQVLDNGNIVAAGLLSDGGLVSLFDNVGNLLWSNAYYYTGGTIFISGVAATTDGSFVMGGTYNRTNSQPFCQMVMKIDSLGNFTWSKIIVGPFSVGDTPDIISTLDGKYLVAIEPEGFYDPSYCQFGLLCMDSSGNAIWNKFYNVNNNYYNFPHKVIQSLDSGFAGIGHGNCMNDWLTGAYFVKTDNVGNTTCNDTTYIISTYDTLAAQQNVGQLNTGLIEYPVTVTGINNSIVVKDACSCSTLSIAEAEILAPRIKVYPNPSHISTTIEIDQDLILINAFLELYNTLGSKVYSWKIDRNKIHIGDDILPNGLYIYKIYNDKVQIANGKLIIN